MLRKNRARVLIATVVLLIRSVVHTSRLLKGSIVINLNIADYGIFIVRATTFPCFRADVRCTARAMCERIHRRSNTTPSENIFMYSFCFFADGRGGVTKKKYVVILSSTRVSGFFFFIVSLHHGSEFV